MLPSHTQTAQTAQTAAAQDAKAVERKATQSVEQNKSEEAAAQLIQRNYRGYRERRQLKGMGLDPSTRWVEAVKEARWRNATRPVSRAHRVPKVETSDAELRARSESDAARQTWKRVGEIARRAGGDDPTDFDENEDSMTEAERAEYRHKKAEQKKEREKSAKIMDLQYFLEMVDQKHRYGSNLRAYHEEWKNSATNENFFYWLDKGEGRNVELPTVSRERLEKEQIRYLSREERMNYLVKIDKEGRLCWAKNGERISTTAEYKDSINGIVPRDDDTPSYRPEDYALLRHSISSLSSSSSDSSSSDMEESSQVEGEHYVNHDLKNAKGVKKIRHVSAATILNHLLRSSVKPNSWIFVADTSFRLYVGIKQSGAFQHSSFLHGARISAAGLIRIKNGQLRRLSPLSGHYRPPTKNFRTFVHSLRDNGVDMSRVSISRSYAVLVGLEVYVRTRKKFKHGIHHAGHQKDKVLHPEETRRREEAQIDKSQSAEKERQVLADRTKSVEEEKRENSFRSKVMRRLRIGSVSSKDGLSGVEHERETPLSTGGENAESGSPPEG